MNLAVLDAGYVHYVTHCGSDEDIIAAARMSTGKDFRGWGTPEKPGDEKLLSYLWGHKHYTPFEMCQLILEIKAPIFVFREWHRHRTQSYNEMSARYIPLPDENYVPTVSRLIQGAQTAGANKQAQGTGGAILTEAEARRFQMNLQFAYGEAQTTYEAALSVGVPKELARLILPVGRYSRMRASANLRNWLAFLTLRLDPAAQWEIRQYAEAVSLIIKTYFPKTWELFEAGRLAELNKEKA